MIYRAVVKKKVRNTFDALNAGDSSFLISQFADSFSYDFVGDHALGGRRTSVAKMEEWFARLDRIFESLTFTPLAVEVGGPPWSTTVLAEVALSGTLAGKSYSNVLFQRIELRMGRIAQITSLEDTQHLTTELQRAANAGIAEATAPPIVGG